MSTPKTLRELVEVATPGPRFINDLGFTPVRVSSGTIMNATGLYATFDAGDYAQTREQGFANAALCCRLSPEVVLRVYEAINSIVKDAKVYGLAGATNHPAVKCEVHDLTLGHFQVLHAALSALDGVTDTNNQKST